MESGYKVVFVEETETGNEKWERINKLKEKGGKLKKSEGIRKRNITEIITRGTFFNLDRITYE